MVNCSDEKRAGSNLSHRQVETIRHHLAMVFKHEIDPSMGSAEHQKELNDVHDVMEDLAKSSPNTRYRC